MHEKPFEHIFNTHINFKRHTIFWKWNRIYISKQFTPTRIIFDEYIARKRKILLSIHPIFWCCRWYGTTLAFRWSCSKQFRMSNFCVQKSIFIWCVRIVMHSTFIHFHHLILIWKFWFYHTYFYHQLNPHLKCWEFKVEADEENSFYCLSPVARVFLFNKVDTHIKCENGIKVNAYKTCVGSAGNIFNEQTSYERILPIFSVVLKIRK